jgi:hypothetical protein
MRPVPLFMLIAALVANVVWAGVPATPVSDASLCGSFPKLYKEIIWSWMQSQLVDANSAKIEWEGDPQCSDLGEKGEHLYGWLVNFKVNARNRFGAYTGKQSHAALIRDGKVIKTFGFGY